MNELTDLSLLILADLAGKPQRLKQRIETLAHSHRGKCSKYPPKPLQALAERGWVEVRKFSDHNYAVEITDAGIAKHREIINQLRTL